MGKWQFFVKPFLVVTAYVGSSRLLRERCQKHNNELIPLCLADILESLWSFSFRLQSTPSLNHLDTFWKRFKLLGQKGLISTSFCHHCTASIYYKTNLKLLQKCGRLDFSTTDCNLLQIIVFLRGNLLLLKVPASSSNMFIGVQGSISGSAQDKSQ